VILNVDFSQGELRITACIADEPTMIQTYRDGIDLHLKTGAQLARIELDEAIQMMVDDDPGVKKIRQGGKAGNFGLIYEMGADGFVDYARTTFGLHLTLKEAQNFMRAFFDLYDQLPVWHDNTKQFAHENGYIESPLGRVRRVPLINSFSAQVRRRQERQAVNAGVQATLTDMGLLAMAELDRAYPDLWQFGFTHDAISFYVKEDEVDEQAARIKSVMENLPFDKFDWHPQLDFPVDIELGVSNLADVHNFDI
jgi:DNA polymerase I-like protein with 3'-5' exonuclease and polymerase domains